MATVSGSVVNVVNAAVATTYISLPGGLLDGNKIYWYKRTDSSGFLCQLQCPSGKTIDGASTLDIPTNSSLGIWYDGSNYYLLSFTQF